MTACAAQNVAFTMPGDPSPWGWARTGSNEETFQCEARLCLDASSAARESAQSGQKAEAAYSTFLTCMEERGWARAEMGLERRHLRNVPKWDELQGCEDQ